MREYIVEGAPAATARKAASLARAAKQQEA
jgi:hypothetical protein